MYSTSASGEKVQGHHLKDTFIIGFTFRIHSVGNYDQLSFLLLNECGDSFEPMPQHWCPLAGLDLLALSPSGRARPQSLLLGLPSLGPVLVHQLEELHGCREFELVCWLIILLVWFIGLLRCRHGISPGLLRLGMSLLPPALRREGALLCPNLIIAPRESCWLQECTISAPRRAKKPYHLSVCPGCCGSGWLLEEPRRRRLKPSDKDKSLICISWQ